MSPIRRSPRQLIPMKKLQQSRYPRYIQPGTKPRGPKTRQEITNDGASSIPRESVCVPVDRPRLDMGVRRIRSTSAHRISIGANASFSIAASGYIAWPKVVTWSSTKVLAHFSQMLESQCLQCPETQHRPITSDPDRVNDLLALTVRKFSNFDVIPVTEPHAQPFPWCACGESACQIGNGG
jgi:hypothetical protein